MEGISSTLTLPIRHIYRVSLYSSLDWQLYAARHPSILRFSCLLSSTLNRAYWQVFYPSREYHSLLHSQEGTILTTFPNNWSLDDVAGLGTGGQPCQSASTSSSHGISCQAIFQSFQRNIHNVLTYIAISSTHEARGDPRLWTAATVASQYNKSGRWGRFLTTRRHYRRCPNLIIKSHSSRQLLRRNDWCGS